MERNLLLTSEGKNPKTFKDIENFVGGFHGQRCLWIPTAMNGDFPVGKNYGIWEKGTTNTLFTTANLDLDILVLEETGDVDLTDRFLAADFIYMQGGSSSYLLHWLFRRSIDLILPIALDQGVKYIGSSAGSMVCSPTNDIEEWYLSEHVRGAHYLPGLNLLDFDIYPHYEEKDFDEIKAHYRGKMMYLLKNGESILVQGNSVTVIGEKRTIES